MNEVSFINDNYITLIENEINEKPNRTSKEIEEKSNRVFKNLLNTNGITIERGASSEFFNDISLALKKISYCRSGRKLLKGLFNSKLKICDSSIEVKKNSRYDFFKHALYVSPNINFYYHNKEGLLTESRFEAVLAHELIHVFHMLKNPENLDARKNITSGLIDPAFHNLEEQMTISGLLSPLDKFTQNIFLCENMFLKYWELPLRKNHEGLELFSVEISEGPLGIGAMITAKAFENLRCTFTSNKESLNLPLNLDWIKFSADSSQNLQELMQKSVLPLSFAAHLGDEETLQFLLEQGALASLEDDLGGPIIASCSKSYRMAKILIKEGIRRDENIGWEVIINRLLEGYRNLKFPDVLNSVSFFELLFLLQKNFEKSSSCDPILPLPHRFLKELPHSRIKNAFEAVMEKDGIEGLKTVDSEGNNLLMELISHLKRIPKKGNLPLKIYSPAKLLFKLLKEEGFDLGHQNLKGETLLTRVIELADCSVAKEVLKEFDRRKIVVEEELRNHLEDMISE